MAANKPPQFASIPLAQVPDVTEFLTRLDLGVFREDDVSTFFGRNDSWAGVTSLGIPVFVKRVGGAPEDVVRRIARIRAMGELLGAHPVVRGPRFLGADERSGLVAFLLLEQARNGADLGAEEFTRELAHEAGVQVGTLHTLPAPAAVAADTSTPPLPPVPNLTAIPLESYVLASGAELEAWRIVHNDAELVEAIKHLSEWERESPRALVHGDLRLDQFLYHEGRLHLVDWEEARLADPARDVGAFVGEWLFRGVLGMASGEDIVRGPVDDRDVIAGGARRFEQLRPFIEAFWQGYSLARPQARADLELPARAAAFAGWHMFDRLFAAGFQRARLTPLERAAAGVGRKALLSPAAFTTTLGLGGEG
ncbi:class V lanthionine synthetase subunit LxmK [Microbispora sp. CA-135349]|uniref:class V lanthionine synthetase subunit LxmK n=1 Tax=Microbispora sp. CA-135349 TaxID=3239953 RepID=UPI003D950705